MSLRLRLFLLLGALLALVGCAQWFLVRSLTEGLRSEVGSVALQVGQSVVSVLERETVARVHDDDLEVEVAEDHRIQAAPPEDANVRVFRLKARCEGGGEDCLEEVDLDAAGAGATLFEEHLEGPGEHRIEYRVLRRGSESGQAEDGEGTAEAIVTREQLAADLSRIGIERKMVVDRLDDPGQGVLVLEAHGLRRHIPIPQRNIEQKLGLFGDRLMGGTLAILAVGLVLAGVVAHRVSVPIRRLGAAARRVGEGAFGEQVPVEAGGEVGAALTSFNLMSSRLATLEADARRHRERRHLSELGEVARGLAHTLRNPLNALGLSVEELAQEGVGDERRTGLAEAARRQIRRIDRSIRSFLALASGGAGSPEPVDLGELARDVVLEALQDGGGKARIEARVEPGLPALDAVAPELRAVVQALVINAVEASPPGGAVTVSVGKAEGDLEGSDPRLRLEVADEGPGLPAEVRRKLFTPHVSTKPHGSGMGLYLAHRIATGRYDGSLRLDDRPGGGTLAVLELGPRGDAPEGEGHG